MVASTNTQGQHGNISPEQLRKDRITMVVIVACMMAVIAILATLSAIGVLPEPSGTYDYWMMP